MGFPRYLVQTPRYGLLLMDKEAAAEAVKDGGARLYGLVQTDVARMRPITRQEQFNIEDRAENIPGSK